MLTGLTAGTTYHYGITVTSSGGNTASTVDAKLKTLPSGTPILGYAILSHITVGATEVVKIRVTNTGPGDALNFKANTFLANRGVTLPAGTTFGGAGNTRTRLRASKKRVTNRPAPARANDVAPLYLGQLRLYFLHDEVRVQLSQQREHQLGGIDHIDRSLSVEAANAEGAFGASIVL